MPVADEGLRRAAALWDSGRRQEAIQQVVALVNAAPPEKRLPYLTPLGYYLAMSGDWAAAAGVMQRAHALAPRDAEILLNLGVCRGRSGEPEAALQALLQYRALGGNSVTAWDSLANQYHRLGRLDEARQAGEAALAMKDAAADAAGCALVLPDVPPSAIARAPGKRNVLSFTLWGCNPRYLRGALHNALRAPVLYPGWSCLFHVDDSVPEEFLTALAGLGVEIVQHGDCRSGQPCRERLLRRFWVANDQGVGYFLVRDCDSVISEREAAAVREWLESDQWFHVMRDWWTHTDPMLAGLWGGVAGVLPDMRALFRSYRSGLAETWNNDQWFLRDRVWPLIRDHALVHDRCFKSRGARPFPGPVPQGERHVGDNEIVMDRAGQEQALGEWIERLECLRL